MCSGQKVDPLPAPSLPERADVLAFGPHPDDVEFCAGGFMLKMKRKGYRCVVVDFVTDIVTRSWIRLGY